MKEIWENHWKPNAKIVSFEGIKRLIDVIIVSGLQDVDDSIINNLRYLENTLGDPSPEGQAVAHWNELSSALEEVLTSLNYQEQKVLILRYGLEDGKYRLQRDVGLLCGVTAPRISQVQRKALRKLRHPARSRKLVRPLKSATPPLNQSSLEKVENMSEKILRLDELEIIAKEYVQHKENKSDVKIITTKPSFKENLPIYTIEGSVREHGMSLTFCDAIMAECSFKLWISAKDGKIIDYRLGEWIKKNVEQTSPNYSQPESIFVEPIELLRTKSPLEEMFDSQAERNLKKAQEDKERAQAHYYEEKAKNEREKRHKPLW